MTSVSFVVTVFNKRPYLAPMLASLRNQVGDFPREFIFVDDGSTDHSAAAIAEHTADWQNVQILHQDNQGPAIALNKGFAAARHPYIMILDGDDILAPYATRLLLEQAEKLNCGLIHGDGTWYDSDAGANIAPEPKTISQRTIDLHHVVKFSHCGSSGVLLRTDVVRRAGGCDDRVFVQEHSLFLRMAHAAPVILIDPVLSFAPRHVEGRIMENSSDGNPTLPIQTVHDRMIAMSNFLRDNPDLPPVLGSVALKNCATDLWKWLHASGHRSPLLLALAWLWFSRIRYGVKNVSCPMIDEGMLIAGMAEIIRRHASVRLTNAARATDIARVSGLG
ncbi:MAG: glycosyltransferase family 2 protein [Rhodospirillales bacterium]